MKLSFLVDNKTENCDCFAEWGLSILIESNGHRVLMDVGASDVFIKNAASMGIDLSDVEAVYISHGHYDHTEGMEAFSSLNTDAPIFIHNEAFHKSYGVDDNGNAEESNCGLRWDDSLIETLKPRFVLTEGVWTINDNMTLVGNIPVTGDFNPTEKFLRETENGLEPDPMNHEQFLAVEEDEKIYILSGCCHKGVVPTIMRAKELFPGKTLQAVIGGFHMYPLKKTEREKMVSQIKELGVKKVYPLHCTGMDAIVEFKRQMGDDCVIACAGDVYEL